ncbi:MAG TPA: HEAT repeat domain-containing protein [Polyangia bacterium]|nr:HEAT repeat domain-containing protein [Polyangia bacterium]
MNAATILGALAGLMVALAGRPGWAADGGFAWPGTAELAARDLTSLDRTQRLRAVEQAIVRDGADIARDLMPMLQDNDPQVRGAAARALARRGAPEAIDAATRWIGSAAPADRPLGLEVLREADALSAAARRAVERSLADNDAAVRLLAIDALARHDLAPSYASIAAALDDEHREIRLRAVRLLQRLHDPRAPMVLLGRLSDADRQVRVEAIQALGALGDARAVPALTRELMEGSDDLRIAAIGALGRLKVASVVSLLAPLARRRPVDDIGRQAQLALGEIATPPALAILLERLRDPPISDQTREGLRRAGPQAVAPLCAELSNGGAGSAGVAAALLGEIGDRRATAALADLVQRRGAATGAALTALAALKDPTAVVALIHATGDPSPEIRRLGYQAMLAIGDHRAQVSLSRGLNDPDSAVRQSALLLAARLGARSVAATVVARLGDGDEAVRRAATTALIALDIRVPEAATTTVAALLAALRLVGAATGARASSDRAALGDALEAAATDADAARLDAAVRDTSSAGRAAIVRGLIAAHGAKPIEDGTVIDRLFEMLDEGGPAAATAADALVAARLPDDRAAALVRAFEEAESPVRARLCAAFAKGGAEALSRLDVVLEDQAEPDDVRAAAAWSAAAVPSPERRAVLERLAGARHPAVAANARAALAVAGTANRDGVALRSPGSWVGVRLLAPTGAPLPQRWLMARARGGLWIWARTDDDGMARIWGLGDGPIEISAAEPASVRLRRPPAGW